jgi:hypothetical protein
MLRWGILPTLIWHYSVDAMYSALLLLRSHSLYFRLSGAACAGIFVVPILVALVAYWRSGGFAPATGLLNGDEPAAAEAPPPAPRRTVHVLDHAPLSGRMRLIALAVFVAGLAAALIPAAHFGDSPRYKLTAGQARAPADAFLRAQGVDPGAYRQVTYPDTHWGGDDSLAAKYFLERRPLNAASKLFEQYRPVQIWATRYFKSLEKEEFLVTVHPESGKVLGFHHEIPEDRAGADLSPDAARQIAAEFATGQGLDVAAMELKESQSEKRKARRDYSLVWEARSGDPRNVDEAHYRVDVAVDGDRVSSLRSYWKIPETFERSRGRQNFISIAVLTVRISAVAAGIVFGLWMLIRQIRLGLVPWRRTLYLAAIPTLTTAIVMALSFHVFLYRNYQTSIPFETFTATVGVVLAMQAAFVYVLYGAAAALLLSFFPESVAAFRRVRRVFAVDAAVLLLLAIGLWYFCQQLSAVSADRFHPVAILGVDDPSLVGLPVPALAAVANVVRAILTRAALLALVVLAVRKLPRRWMLAPLLLLAVCTLVSEEARTPGEFALEFGLAFVGVACAVAFCAWFARRNYLAYVLVVGMGAAHSALAELFHSGNAELAMQGWIVVAAAAAGLAWAVGPGLFARAAPQGLRP